MKSYTDREKKTENKERRLFYNSFGERVLHYRKSISMSQAELAEKTGLSKVTISSIENGSPTETYNVHILAQALDKPVGSLIYGYMDSEYVQELLMEIGNLHPEYQQVIYKTLECMISEMKTIQQVKTK